MREVYVRNGSKKSTTEETGNREVKRSSSPGENEQNQGVGV